MSYRNFDFRSMRRRLHNVELIARMQKGDPLMAFPSEDSWFPPRPLIKKNFLDIQRLYPNLSNMISLKS